MKKLFCALLLTFALALTAPVAAQARPVGEYDCAELDHPLRYVAYALHPVGVVAECLVLRPVRWVVSRPVLDKLFGYEPPCAGPLGSAWDPDLDPLAPTAIECEDLWE